MSYGKVMNYKDENNTDKSIFLKPVSPFRFKELFRLAKKFDNGSMENMDDESVTDLVNLCTETINRSAPEWTLEQKEEFITIHFNDLVTNIIEINKPK